MTGNDVGQPGTDTDLGRLASPLVVLLSLYAVSALVAVAFRPALILADVLNLIIAAVFLTWFYRARRNAARLAWPQRWSPGWAIGGWFVPIGLLWIPYQVMADIWRASLPAEAWRPWLPAGWWACWCLAWFTGLRKVGSVESFYFGGTSLSIVFAAAAAVLLALMVIRVSAGSAAPQPAR